ncbi:MAG: 5-(carboxyamino)imidazole ribonucleotide mutase [Planctomycetota bacterium]|nr:5-(carboxyamino)imidazole ribonucleotide mutase [Planctomycetota bacterium]
MRVAVVAGSASDVEYVKRAKKTFESLDIGTDVFVLSAHRTPDEAVDFAKSAEKKGYSAIIAIAGMAAHLAGVLSANTVLPVIAVPVATGAFGGLDALLSSVQMPKGVPVGVVTVGETGAENAALLIARFLAVNDLQLKKRLLEHKERLRKDALASQRDLENSL